MKISFRILKKWWFWVGTILFMLFITIYIILHFRMNDAVFTWFLDDNGYELKATHYNVGEQQMRYVQMGGEERPMILAIHGAPGSSIDWIGLFNDSTLVNRVKLVAVDRPGYGYSDFGNIEPSLEKQAKLIAPILKKHREKHKTIVVIGYSYGGPVAARLAMDYPDLIDGLMLMAASVAPGEEKTYSVSYPTSNKWLEWLVPQSFVNANHEKLTHRESLLRMTADWDRIKAVTTILHGDADNLIYQENAHFAARKLINAESVKKIILPNIGHEIPFSHPDLVYKFLLEAVKRTEDYQATVDNSVDLLE
ncbi:MAG: alpha/beta fold hydrolase [Saprospiraceae bacterium]